MAFNKFSSENKQFFLFFSFQTLPVNKISKTPRTAPLTSSTHFPFDPPESPKSVRNVEKNQILFTFDDIQDYMKLDKRNNDKENKKRKEKRSSYVNGQETQNNKLSDERRDKNDVEDKKCKKEKYGSSQFINSFRSGSKKEKYNSNKKINSAPPVPTKEKYCNHTQKLVNFDEIQDDETMFPFDREAIDYERIQRECFAVEDESKFPFNFDTDQSSYDPDSPIYEKPIFDSPSNSYKKSDVFYENSEKYQNSDLFYQYKLLSHQDSYQNYERRPSKRNKSEIFDHISKSDAFSPNLSTSKQTVEIHQMSRFDQISNRFDQIGDLKNKQQETAVSPSANNSRSSPTPPNLRIDFFAESTKTEKLDGCQKMAHTAGAINVTQNPMDSAVYTQPRATIVVQQVNLIFY